VFRDAASGRSAKTAIPAASTIPPRASARGDAAVAPHRVFRDAASGRSAKTAIPAASTTFRAPRGKCGEPASGVHRVVPNAADQRGRNDVYREVPQGIR
jgi:hypothetical protein